MGPRARWWQWREAKGELSGPHDWAGLLPSLLVLILLVVLDIALGERSIFATSFLLAPFFSAFAGGRRSTLLTASLAVGLAAASGAWNHNFGETDYWVRLLLIGLAGGMACFTAAAESDAGRTMRRFQLLNEVAEVADGTVSLAHTVRAITDVVVPELADICMIDVISDRGVERAAVHARGPRREELERGLGAREPSIPARMLHGETDLEPRFIEVVDEDSLRDLAHDAADLEFLRTVRPRSSVTLALSARGRRVGALTLVVTEDSGRRYSRDDVRFARVLADRVALALDNAGLFSDLQSIERRMDTVMGVLEEAVVIHDSGGNVVFANAAAARMFGFDDPDEMVALPRERWRERYDVFDESGEPLSRDQVAPIRALHGEAPVTQTFRMISHATGEELWLRAKAQTVEGLEGRPLYAVTALEDLTELKEKEFAQTLLARTGELLTSSNDYAATVERLAALPIPQLADWCSIFAPRADGMLEQVAIAHRDPERGRLVERILDEFPFYASDEEGIAAVLRSGEELMLDDISPLLDLVARDSRHRELMEELRFGSAMIMPMRISGSVIGTINFVNDTDRRPFDDFDRDLARRFAVRAAVALDNARLASERTEIAETLQRGLLPPPLPEIPGWSAAALYRPAGEQNEVGGDFYDVFRMEAGWMLVIGDVTGRGARAAAVTAQARYTLRTAAAITSDPLVTLAALNRALLARAEPALCSVAALTLRDHAQGSVEIAVAGHPPPLLVGTEAVREAAGPGPVLGAFPDASWTLESCGVQPGELLVVFTDGVTEATGSEGRFGEERLRERLLGTGAPGAAVQTIEAALEEFTGGDLTDDAAVLAVAPAAMRRLEGSGFERAAELLRS
jgi:PAS domain S-box-containing protein